MKIQLFVFYVLFLCKVGLWCCYYILLIEYSKKQDSSELEAIYVLGSQVSVRKLFIEISVRCMRSSQHKLQQR